MLLPSSAAARSIRLLICRGTLASKRSVAGYLRAAVFMGVVSGNLPECQIRILKNGKNGKNGNYRTYTELQRGYLPVALGRSVTSATAGGASLSFNEEFVSVW